MSDINPDDIIFIKKNLKSIASHLKTIEQKASEADRIVKLNEQKMAQLQAIVNQLTQQVNVLRATSMGNGAT